MKFKSRLSKEKIEIIIAAIKECNFVETALQSVGVPHSTYYYWKSEALKIRQNKGKRKHTEDEALLLDFLDKIKEAEAEAEKNLLKTIRAHSFTTWQAAAWILERKHPERWGRKDTLKLVDEVQSGSTRVQGLRHALNNMTDADLENLIESLDQQRD